MKATLNSAASETDLAAAVPRKKRSWRCIRAENYGARHWVWLATPTAGRVGGTGRNLPLIFEPPPHFGPLRETVTRLPSPGSATGKTDMSARAPAFCRVSLKAAPSPRRPGASHASAAHSSTQLPSLPQPSLLAPSGLALAPSAPTVLLLYVQQEG